MSDHAYSVLNASVLNASVLIVASPGELRESLQALLATLPQVGQVLVANDGAGALSAIERHCPELLVVAGDIPVSNAHRLLERAKQECPESKFLVLVDSTAQLNEAESAGADRAVLKGYPASQLLRTASELINRPGAS